MGVFEVKISEKMTVSASFGPFCVGQDQWVQMETKRMVSAKVNDSNFG